MKRALLAIALLVSSCATMRHQETGFLNRSLMMNGHEYPYVVYVPRDFSRGRAWPVILFLHGAGERGGDGLKETQIGVAAAIRHDPSRVPAIVVFQQVPEDQRWIGEPADAAIAALDRATREFNGDPAQTYLTGLSMGGYGTIHIALANPNRFAALVVVCGGLLPHPTATSVAKSPLIPDDVDPYLYVAKALRKTPIWIFHGTDDQTIPVRESEQLAAAFTAVSGDVHFTEYPGTGHNAWDKAYAELELWRWLFHQQRH